MLEELRLASWKSKEMAMPFSNHSGSPAKALILQNSQGSSRAGLTLLLVATFQMASSWLISVPL